MSRTTEEVFGFPHKPAGTGAYFLPILKYDARAGRFFRVDRGHDGTGWVSTPVPIENRDFKAMFDLEHVECGWIDFSTGGAPSFLVVARGNPFPPEPPKPHKYKVGTRIVIKLAPRIGGEAPVREFTSTAQVWLDAMAELILAYDQSKLANPGLLPVVTLAGDALPVTTGQGAKTSTNYQPRFQISAWAPRGDLTFVPRAPVVYAPPPMPAHPAAGAYAPAPQAAPRPQPSQRPATGAQPAVPPGTFNTPPAQNGGNFAPASATPIGGYDKDFG